MTTIRDLLRDFQLESIKQYNSIIDDKSAEEITEELEELVEEYIEAITERIVGWHYEKEKNISTKIQRPVCITG